MGCGLVKQSRADGFQSAYGAVVGSNFKPSIRHFQYRELAHTHTHPSIGFSMLCSLTYFYFPILTLEPPDSPTDLLITAENSTSWLFTWSMPFDGNLPITYTLLADNGGQSEQQTVATLFARLSVMLLAPFTPTNFSVHATNRLGSSPATVVQRRTPQAGQSQHALLYSAICCEMEPFYAHTCPNALLIV